MFKLRPHRREDYCTKMAAVAPDYDCEIPLWHDFIDFVTEGDRALAGYLQRACGYTLTGITTEQCVFVLHGIGANGKSVFINSIAGILGSYAMTAAIETFTATRHERHPEELAALRAVRMVIASEAEAGHAWNEARIKLLTGGEKIRARYMGQNSFEFRPQFKLWIVTNHKPRLSTNDPALARRIHMVPFNAQVSSEHRNKHLGDDLKGEWPGILAWMLDGCEAWQQCGLDPPAAVIDATASYLSDEDTLQAWIDEECDPLPSAETTSAELYVSWKKWAEARGEFPGSNRALTDRLERKGFKKRHTNRGSAFRGLALRAYLGTGERERFF
jgi:putative DNA primase/helicase